MPASDFLEEDVVEEGAELGAPFLSRDGQVAKPVESRITTKSIG